MQDKRGENLIVNVVVEVNWEARETPFEGLVQWFVLGKTKERKG